MSLNLAHPVYTQVFTVQSVTLIVMRKAIEMTDTTRAQMFVSLMCRMTSMIVRTSTKYPCGRFIAIPSSNGICIHTDT